VGFSASCEVALQTDATTCTLSVGGKVNPGLTDVRVVEFVSLMEEQLMSESLPEQQKTQLIVRSPLSTEGFILIYFSSPDGRLMSEEEWSNLRQLIELTNNMCIKQKAVAQSA
jgi:hypothetical protein